MTDNSTAIIWALLTAAMLALQGVATARPLRHIGILAASLLTNIVNVVVLGLLGAYYYVDGQMTVVGMGWFALLGISAYSYGRFVYYKALFTIGPPRLTTMMSTAPLLSLGLAVLFLGERPGPAVLFGTFLVIMGVVFVSYEPSEKGWFHKGILWGFASALSLGMSAFIRKKGLASFPDPILTVAWANFVGAIVLSSLRPLVPAELFRWGGRSTIIAIILLGVLNSANQVFMNIAIKMGDVSVVTPIIASSPIFSIFFTALFLRGFERVRPAMVFGVFFTVGGMVFIVLGR
ncbi:MAG: DMT family transporter [Nitrospinaceae bacterium]|nr:DMT family transporter [Nitrospinaceae bacterium]MBT3821610.1 DMT family transporter [Nitrospinaceae bacterium]MBT4093984.1 DMT family transporter [Nitrospinaceae bacterium]MBT4430292.1 DMT family transporter [Nitrospinaceae bacterium]MBT5367833.1 DMT family transporter [Nitrospinaceae bacterium]